MEKLEKIEKSEKLETVMDRGMDRAAAFVGRTHAKCTQMIRNIRNDEVGASELVVLVALIVIILAVVVIFRNQLSTIVKTAGSKVVKWINAN